MLNGFSLPMTPSGKASMVPTPPWHYVGNILRVEYLADRKKVAEYLPEGMEAAEDGHCTLYFIEWQTASRDFPERYLQPEISQYHETLIAIHTVMDGKPMGYCPFIWVDNDTAVLRGHVYGYPKQLGTIAMTRVFNIDSNAAPKLQAGSRFGASAAAKNARLFEAVIELEEEDPTAVVSPAMVTMRQFPGLRKENGYAPELLDLVAGNCYDVKIANQWRGKAQMKIYSDCYPDLEAFQPTKVLAGYYHVQSHTTDDMQIVKELK